MAEGRGAARQRTEPGSGGATRGKSTGRAEPGGGTARGRPGRGGDKSTARVAPSGKIQPITTPRSDGRREPSGRIAPERSARPAQRGKGAPGRVGTVVALLFLVALAVAACIGRSPIWLALVYALMSLVAFICYRTDKRAAVANRQRTPERTLHLLALVGGWPGALLGQSVLRHKSSKTSFLWAFWLTVLVNLAALAWLLWSRIGVGWDRFLIDGWRAAHAIVMHAVDASRH